MTRKLLLVEWVDSHGSGGGWARVEDSRADLLVARSVGWVLHETADCIVLAPHLCEPPEESCIAAQYRGEMTIPTRAILSKRQLR